MLRIFSNEGKNPQKKLISFQNPVLMDGMIKSEAEMYNTSDSYIVERTMIEHYLNTDDYIASAIASNLFAENGIVYHLRLSIRFTSNTLNMQMKLFWRY